MKVFSRRRRDAAKKQHRRPRAAVYRGPVACDGCAESVATLLRHSPVHYRVHYVGPDEVHDVSEEALRGLDVFAWPGGGDDEQSDFQKVKHYTESIQRYVNGGGTYLGICMGAFLARGGDALDEQYFNLLPEGAFVSGERFEPDAQVHDANDTIIQVDWTWQTNVHKGFTAKEQWMYFQDGAVINLPENVRRDAHVAGRYSANQNITAAILPYGQGHVALIGTHPEADQSWYDDYDIVNPQNVSFAIGFDFVQAVHDVGQPSFPHLLLGGSR